MAHVVTLFARWRALALSSSVLCFILVGSCSPDLTDASQSADSPGLPGFDTTNRIPSSTALLVTPDSVVAEMGQKVQFKAYARSAAGDTVPMQVNWSVLGGSITADGLFTAAGAGTYSVVGTGRRNFKKSDSSTVVVVAPRPTMVAISILPATASLAPGAKRSFAAKGVLQDSSTVPVGVTWSATGGTVDASGTYAAGRAAGKYHVAATNDATGISDTVPVTVTTAVPTVRAVVLAPSSATLAPGETKAFTTSALMSDSSTVAIPVRYSATGGTITSGGNFTAGSTAGSYRVIATDSAGALADTASVTIVAPEAATVARVVLSPASISLAAGATKQFTVSDTMSDGTAKPFAGSYTATGGTVSPSGLYTAGSATGAYRVVASELGKADTAEVTVTAPPPPLPPPAPPAGTPGTAEPPRVTVNTAYPTITRQVAVPCGTSLQTAINNAVRGDELRLAHGCTYPSISLPNKTGTGWVVIASDGTLPAPGTRVTLATVAQLAKIASTSQGAAVSTVNGVGTGFYRLVGLEIVGPTTATLTQFGSGSETTLGTLVHDITIDRSYIHPTTTGQAMFACIEQHVAGFALVDSWLDNCHATSAVSVDGGYGIRTYLSPGPILIENNYIAASGVNMIFGGHDPSIPNLVTSDVTIRRNYFYKDPAWKGVFVDKNVLESKSSQRVLFEANVINGNWADASGQNGIAIILRSSNQNGACTWCVTQDWTLRYNKLLNSGAGITIAGSSNPVGTSVMAKRITLFQNVMDRLNVSSYLASSGVDGVLLQFGQGPQDVVLAHNTFVVSTTSVGAVRWANLGPLARFVFRDNIVTRGTTGVQGCSGACAGEGTASLTQYAPGAVFAGNAIIGASASLYPIGNFFPSSLSAVGFANPAAYDWTLTAGSPFKGKATDGTDPGADIAAIEAATRGVAAQ